MSEVSKLLFHGVPDHTAEADLTTGPGAGKVWTVGPMWICNTHSEARKLTLKIYIDASNTRALMFNTTFAPNQPEIVHGLVIAHGHKIIAQQETENAIEITAYGLEGDV